MNLLGSGASVILGLSSFIIPGFSRTPDPIHMTVRVFDYVGLPRGDQAEMQTSAKRVLHQAEVAVEFVVCRIGEVDQPEMSCWVKLGPTDFSLRILHPRLAPKGERLGYAAMTLEGGAIVTVFANPAVSRVRVSRLSDGVLLGHALAHEIGHLLLGANSHSSSGIMRPVFGVSDEEWMAKGMLIFSADQVRRMRVSLVARLDP